MTPDLILSFAKIYRATQTTKARQTSKISKVKATFYQPEHKKEPKNTKTKEKAGYTRKKGSENKTAKKQQHKPLFMQR
jgi:hypothetical protein